MIIEEKRQQKVISDTFALKLGEQLSKIAANKRRLVHFYFKKKRGRFKRTTGSNEVRHRNMKKGDDRVRPNHTLASTAQKISMRGEDETKQKKKRSAYQLTSEALWNTNDLGVTDYAERVFLGEWHKSKNYVWVRISHDVWYVISIGNNDNSSSSNTKKKYLKLVQFLPEYAS